jgi:hypothetical protein
VTSLQEQTLTIVPKMLAVLADHRAADAVDPRHAARVTPRRCSPDLSAYGLSG